ncbi:RagB/SusD family nutrient uptake outer membrane protein [Flavobacterium silvaticum]|uniref:RagB/SusD family nutrient uptake outer membrane protein n=1 Tax=Flavobacterium silvaticum TaxID=1852020 RepID=A0A972JF35_9FLAO|nr:RagB/SusD family nutrient uptake outer membrane protein [Flavobacterium silvaticum]NMH27539.1 RagB/SusD family nutrient uptake outer membrane protein [Flavobacterium silvaticum]
MKRILKLKKNILLASLALMAMAGCTNVDENVYDQYIEETFYGTEEGANAALAAVYSQVAGNWNGVGYAGADNGWYDLNCMTADEQVIPHRTTGDWQLDFARLYKHEWLPSDFILTNTWNWLYKSIYQANRAVGLLENANADPAKIAEAKVLRAFFYYMLIDDFGSVPFYTENGIPADQIPQASRTEVYDFIVSELTENIDLLSSTKGGEYYGRFNRWAGYALLAKVYLNAEVYTGTAHWQDCLAACDVISTGGFSLHPANTNAGSPLGNSYYELFGDMLPEDETILAMFSTVDIVSRNVYALRSLYGPHGQALFGYSGWNGTIVPSPFYESFADGDIRKKQFLVGDQGGGVNYTLEVGSLDNPGAAPMAGVRDVKFYPALPLNGGGASNDFPIYRYADILLMKAECNLRLGNASTAKPFVDQVRQRAGMAVLASDPSLMDIYNERGFELNWEAHRRQDMIRFGTFLNANQFRAASPDNHNVFPIPTDALDTNPNLQQNPGY